MIGVRKKKSVYVIRSPAGKGQRGRMCLVFSLPRGVLNVCCPYNAPCFLYIRPAYLLMFSSVLRKNNRLRIAVRGTVGRLRTPQILLDTLRPQDTGLRASG